MTPSPAKQRTTIREVAARAGVSLGTASRALSDSGPVAKTTRDKVLSAAAALDFRPNAHARSLRSAHSRSLGLLIPDVRNPFFSELAHEIEQVARTHGMTTLLCNADESPEQMQLYVQALREHRVDGVIAAPFVDAHDALGALTADGIPVVHVDRHDPASTTPSVTSDTSAAIDQAIAHLAFLGHTHIGCISGPARTSTGAERLAEVRASAQAHNLALDVVPGDFQEESGRRGAAHLLERGHHAIIAADSLMTVGALRETVHRGIHLGVELDLIGFDDIPMFTLTTPAISVISQDVRGMGRIAATMIHALHDGDTPESVRLPAHLVLRGSTAPLSVPNDGRPAQ